MGHRQASGIPLSAAAHRFRCAGRLGCGGVVAIVLAATVAGCVEGRSLSGHDYDYSIVDASITIRARTHQPYDVFVPDAATKVLIRGSFKASGGSGNDIIVMILNGPNYHKWRDGENFEAYYNSGKVTERELRTALPDGAGAYHLIFDNGFSTFSDKTVHTAVNLQYVVLDA